MTKIAALSRSINSTTRVQPPFHADEGDRRGDERGAAPFEESLLKAVRSLEIGVNHIHSGKFDGYAQSELEEYVREGRDDRLYALAELIRRGTPLSDLYEADRRSTACSSKKSKISPISSRKSPRIHRIPQCLRKAKQAGFCGFVYRASSGRCPSARSSISVSAKRSFRSIR